jgi:glutaryl-CoA dehydrogenase
MYPIHAFGSEEHRKRWLPAMAKAEAIGCFGLTEPQGGSDPSNMKTYAKRDGSDWIINGSKMWITNGTIADVAVVWAKTDEGIRGFLIEKGTRGFEAPEIERKFSLRASITSALYFDNVRVRRRYAARLRACAARSASRRHATASLGRHRRCAGVPKELIAYRGAPNRAGAIPRANLASRRHEPASRRTAPALQLGRLGIAMSPTQVSLAKWKTTHGPRHRARLPRHARRRGHQRRILPMRTCPTSKRHHLRRHRDRTSWSSAKN